MEDGNGKRTEDREGVCEPTGRAGSRLEGDGRASARNPSINDGIVFVGRLALAFGGTLSTGHLTRASSRASPNCIAPALVPKPPQTDAARGRVARSVS